MTLRVILFSDTHLGFDHPIRPRTDKPRRGPDFFANFQRVLDYALGSQADVVIHAGDFFSRSQPHASIVDQAYQALFEFAHSGIPLVIVPGNHERSVLPPSLFLNHPDIHVFDQPGTHRFDIRGEKLAVSGFPYLKDVRARFHNTLADCAAQRCPADFSLLCVHHAVDGATVGPADFTFRGGADVISEREIPAEFDGILSGHIHRHQILACNTPVIYCGSIERTSFAEKGEQKGFCELVLERDAPSPQVTFHELPTRPMVDFDGTSFTQPGQLLDAFKLQSAGWSPRSIVRIRLADYPDARLWRTLTSITQGPLNLSAPTRHRQRHTRTPRLRHHS